MSPLAGVLLAAGGGSRFGGPKALVRYHGQLLVERGAGMLLDAGCAPVVVVLGAGADDVRRQASVPDAVELVDNPDWAAGIGTSLCAGLRALAGRAQAAVVALADQPHVSAQLVARLADAWRGGARCTVASYDGKGRNPVLLDASVWAEVMAGAAGDVGARAWMREHPDEVVLVPCEDLGSESDIDTPGDLERLLREPPHAG